MPIFVRNSRVRERARTHTYATVRALLKPFYRSVRIVFFSRARSPADSQWKRGSRRRRSRSPSWGRPRAFRNSRVSANLSSLLSQSTGGRCLEWHLRDRTRTYAYAAASRLYACSMQRVLFTRESETRRVHRYRGLVRAFVFIMAPIYSLMTTRERTADMAVS